MSTAIDITLLVHSDDDQRVICFLKPFFSWVVVSITFSIAFISLIYKYAIFVFKFLPLLRFNLE